MNICQICHKEFPNRAEYKDKIRVIHKRRYCLDCKPINHKRNKIETRKNTKKKCSVCKQVKPTPQNFHKDRSSRDGFSHRCKQCRILERKIYYQKNKKKVKESIYIHRKNNPKRTAAIAHKSYIKNVEKRKEADYKYRSQLEVKKRRKERYKQNRQKIREYERKRRKEDMSFVLAKRLRERVRSAIVQSNVSKKGSAVQDLGCSIDELKMRLERMFYPHPKTGEIMSWENIQKWQIDHVIPLSSFSLEDRGDFLEAMHWTNLQPLWKCDNLKKRWSWYIKETL